MTDQEKKHLTKMFQNIETLKHAQRHLNKTKFNQLLKSHDERHTEIWQCYLEAKKRHQKSLREYRNS
jgi:hypothetical protein